MNIMNSKKDTDKYFELIRLLKSYKDLECIYRLIVKYLCELENDDDYERDFIYWKLCEASDDLSNITNTLNIQENKLIGCMREEEDSYVDDSVNLVLSSLINLSNKNDYDSIIEAYMLNRDKNYQISKYSTNVDFGTIYLSAKFYKE